MRGMLGHTLGTPDLPLDEALRLFRDAGLDGAEIIWQDGYQAAIPESDDGTVAARVRRRVRELGLVVGGLTPYVWGINSLDEAERRRDVERLVTAIRVAESLDCHRVRIYGGAFSTDEHRAHEPELWTRLVDSLGQLGTVAAEHGVVLCVENHFSTMTESAEQTVRLMRELDLDSVGILYDQANLTFTHCEDYTEAIEKQARWIRHVHVKDLEWMDPDRRLRTTGVSQINAEDRVHWSRMIGDGVLDWHAVVAALDAVGYDGFYSLEYEYRWNPADLPEPAVGFPESARRLKVAMSTDAR
jgi:sugar phosphate isomerase/epimerase